MRLTAHSAASLAARIRQCAEDLTAIARDVASAVDANPNLYAELAAEGIDTTAARRLEKLGRGQIVQQLVFASSPATSRVMRLPLSEQAAAVKGGVEVLDEDEKTVRKIPIHSLTPKQVSVAFAADHIRDIAEQRSVIREKATKLKPVSPGVDFKVFSDHVVTARPMTINRALLLQWIAQMK